MPLPADHLKQSFDISRSLARLSKLMQDADLDEILDSLHDNPSERKKAEIDPTEFLKSKGLPLPIGLTASFKDNNWSFRFCTATKSKVCLIYESKDGWDLEVQNTGLV